MSNLADGRPIRVDAPGRAAEEPEGGPDALLRLGGGAAQLHPRLDEDLAALGAGEVVVRVGLDAGGGPVAVGLLARHDVEPVGEEDVLKVQGVVLHLAGAPLVRAARVGGADVDGPEGRLEGLGPSIYRGGSGSFVPGGGAG